MYGTICAVSALMMSAVVGVVCTSVCIRCKHKGNVYILTFQCHKDVNSLQGKMESIQIELEQNAYQIQLEQNSAYQGIRTLPSSLSGEDMEPCSAYGIVL